MSDLRYYIDDYSDEHVPCDCTLAGWAEWLSKPDMEWRRRKAAQDGSRYQASVTRFEDDIIARRTAGGEWIFSRDPSQYDFLAIRWGPGLGWDPDNIIWGEDMAVALREWFAENAGCCDDEEFVATGMNEPNVTLVYHAGPPATCAVEPTKEGSEQ